MYGVTCIMPLGVVCYNIYQQKFPPNYVYQNGERSDLGTLGTVKCSLIFILLFPAALHTFLIFVSKNFSEVAHLPFIFPFFPILHTTVCLHVVYRAVFHLVTGKLHFCVPIKISERKWPLWWPNLCGTLRWMLKKLFIRFACWRRSKGLLMWAW